MNETPDPARPAARAAGSSVGALADPALVHRARRAQLADVAPLARVQEDVGALAAQQRAPADRARDGHVLRGDLARSHACEASGPQRRCRAVRGPQAARYAVTASSVALSTTFCARWPGTSS